MPHPTSIASAHPARGATVPPVVPGKAAPVRAAVPEKAAPARAAMPPAASVKAVPAKARREGEPEPVAANPQESSASSSSAAAPMRQIPVGPPSMIIMLKDWRKKVEHINYF